MEGTAGAEPALRMDEMVRKAHPTKPRATTDVASFTSERHHGADLQRALRRRQAREHAGADEDGERA